MTNVEEYRKQLIQLLEEFEQQTMLQPRTFFVVGCSTSEVIGEKIGTASSMEVAEAFFEPLKDFTQRNRLYLAFQGCEHINRALTIEQAVADRFGLDTLSVYPTKEAGGSMSAYAYEHFDQGATVESIVAHAGIDIGQTFIGMHFKPVVVPVRTTIRSIGAAITTAATTRPKLIGGVRAQYK